MKRSSGVGLCLLLLTALGSTAQELEIRSLHQTKSRVQFDCTLIGVATEELLASLDEGEAVQVELLVRDESPGRFEFQYETLQAHTRKRARWDAVEKLYVIDSGGENQYFLHKDAFLAELLTFRKIPLLRDGSDSGYFLRGKIRTRILNPPLNILTPFLPGLVHRTDWIELAPPAGADSGGG